MILPFEIKYIISEEVVPSDVINAMNNKQQVVITYDNEENNAPLERVIEPYVYGITKAGNEAIRAYQYYGDTFRGIPKWKLFRLDRIRSWTPTKNHFNQPPNHRGWDAEDYNDLGDGSLIRVLKQISFDEEPENDTLSQMRLKTQNLKNSTPINNFSDMLARNLEITKQEKEKRNSKRKNNSTSITQSGPIINNLNIDTTDNNKELIVPNNSNKFEDEEFQKMLARNLEITRQEKEKRNSKNNNVAITSTNQNGPITDNLPINNNGNISDNNSNTQTIDKETNVNDEEFQKMLARNLEITKQEKEKRKFKI